MSRSVAPRPGTHSSRCTGSDGHDFSTFVSLCVRSPWMSIKGEMKEKKKIFLILGYLCIHCSDCLPVSLLRTRVNLFRTTTTYTQLRVSTPSLSVPVSYKKTKTKKTTKKLSTLEGYNESDQSLWTGAEEYTVLLSGLSGTEDCIVESMS